MARGGNPGRPSGLNSVMKVTSHRPWLHGLGSRGGLHLPGLAAGSADRTGPWEGRRPRAEGHAGPADREAGHFRLGVLHQEPAGCGNPEPRRFRLLLPRRLLASTTPTASMSTPCLGPGQHHPRGHGPQCHMTGPVKPHSSGGCAWASWREGAPHTPGGPVPYPPVSTSFPASGPGGHASPPPPTTRTTEPERDLLQETS